MCRKLSFLVSLVLVLGLVGNASGLEWVGKDIDEPAIAGSAIYDDVNQAWIVSGSGHDIWGTYDGFYYLYQPVEGDCVMDVNLASFNVTNEWLNAGLMIR